MKRRAFTLIELIAVLAILSIIIVISIPQLVNMLNDSKENAREKIYKSITSAARIYASDHDLGESEPILISTLCSTNYLDCPMEDPVTEKEISGYVFSSISRDELKSIEYDVYEGSPVYLYPTLVNTVNGKDVNVDKYAGNGLYKYGDKYIYRGGITKTNTNGLATADYLTDVDSGTDVNNYVKVPWETYAEGADCTTSGNCYRIVSIDGDGNIKLIRNSADGAQAFDNTHNTDASTVYGNPAINYGYNDMLENIPSAGHPEEYRSESILYTTLYGTTGYEKTKIYLYKNILSPFNLCLNKVQNYKNINNTVNPTYVSDTCNITGKPNTIAVDPINSVYVGLPYVEDYINSSTESTCTTAEQYQCRNQNYMYNKQTSWVPNGYYSFSWYVGIFYMYGSISYYNPYRATVGIRPSVILKSTVIISGGTGTATDPYVIMG